MTPFSWATPIREYERVEPVDFERIREAGQPAVLRGLSSDWPAVRAAKEGIDSFAAYLKRFCTDRRVGAIVGPPEIGGRFFYNDTLTQLNFQSGSTQFGPFIDWLLRDGQNPSGQAMAVQSEPVRDALPGFEVENATNLVPATVVPRTWFGNRARVAPHYDLYENLGIVVAGHRRFTLFPPQQLSNLYAGPFDLTPAGTPVSLVDTERPDLDRFPRFKEAMAAAQCALLEPGDAIYIPYHWWHGVDSLDAINLFINYWWSDAPPERGSPYDALIYGLFAFKALPPEQRAVWREVFDHYVFQANGDPAEHLPPQARGVLGPHTPELMERIRLTIKKVAESL